MCFAALAGAKTKVGAETEAAAEQCILGQANAYGDVHVEHALGKLSNDCAVDHSRDANRFLVCCAVQACCQALQACQQYEINVGECSEAWLSIRAPIKSRDHF